MKRLIALKSTAYAGKRLKAGVTFDANDQDVRILKALKWAADAPVVVARKPAPSISAPPASFEGMVVAGTDKSPADEDKPKRLYRRKDMAAE